MASSLKINYLLNLTNTIAGMVFPLITFPYASRILEADGIGIVNFYNSIIGYISLFTCLGIPLYATREIAKVKHDSKLLPRKSAEILLLHIGLTFLGYIVVAILSLFVAKINQHYGLFLILSASLIFTAMGCDWYFRGTEDFKYITIRGLICRIIYIPLLFIFVKTKQDLFIYCILTVFVSVGNNLFNFYRISKLLSFQLLKEASNRSLKHLKGSVKLFLLSSAISLYLQLNILMLGFLSSTTNVGYYTAASRITFIISGLITALQATLVPRSSYLVANKSHSEYSTLLNKVSNFIICFSLPMSMGLIIMAPLIIKIFAGDTFMPASPTLQLLSLNIILSIYNGFICSAVFIPQGKENLATYSCLFGGIVNLILNFILIPVFAQNGTAMAAIITEITVFSGMVILGSKYVPFKIFKVSYLKYLILSLLMFALCYFLWNIDDHEAYRLTVIPIAGILFYLSILLIIKDPLVLSIKNLIYTKLTYRLIKN